MDPYRRDRQLSRSLHSTTKKSIGTGRSHCCDEDMLPLQRMLKMGENKRLHAKL